MVSLDVMVDTSEVLGREGGSGAETRGHLAVLTTSLRCQPGGVGCADLGTNMVPSPAHPVRDRAARPRD
jgi:hypothetical protein